MDSRDGDRSGGEAPGDEKAQEEDSSQQGLEETVIEGGYCIGCGACTAVLDSSFEMEMDDRGQYQATSDGGGSEASGTEEVCPFSAEARDETQIGRALYGDHATFDKHVGYYRSCYAGYVTEGAFREQGSSGGMAKWILYELLRRDLVDAVIQIVGQAPEPADDTVYGYAVMESPAEVLEGSKSVYYPVEMSGALEYVREHPGRYAITGIPCFIKALRLLAQQEPVFEERLEFCVGLVCGHLKSRRYADMIAWQFGVEPGNLAHIDFRKHLPDTRANEKGVEVESIDGDVEVADPDIVQNLYGTNYNHGFFQYEACNFCDDVVAETADISVGDAWLEEYLDDGQGTSIVVTRHPTMDRIIEDGLGNGRLALDTVSAGTIAESQAGGFRQRREGLAYRLHLADEKDRWRPPKRVEPSKTHINENRRRIYDLRMQMTERSHMAFQEALREGDFEIFREEMEPLLEAYRDLYRPKGWERIKKGLLRRVKWVREWTTGELGTRAFLGLVLGVGSPE